MVPRMVIHRHVKKAKQAALQLQKKDTSKALDRSPCRSSVAWFASWRITLKFFTGESVVITQLRGAHWTLSTSGNFVRWSSKYPPRQQDLAALQQAAEAGRERRWTKQFLDAKIHGLGFTQWNGWYLPNRNLSPQYQWWDSIPNLYQQTTIIYQCKDIPTCWSSWNM